MLGMDTKAEFPKTLIDAIKYFADADRAHAFMVQIRWPNGVCCPRCGSVEVQYISTRRTWRCKSKHENRTFSVKVNTIMEDSALKLETWMLAFWLECNSKNSISSYEVARHCGVTQKSAWFMQQRIRLALQSGSFEKLGGQVEVDETFIGGKARNMHASKRRNKINGTGGAGKAVVMGLLQRHGEVRTIVVDDTRRKTLQPHVHAHVEKGTEVFTDALSSYIGLAPEYVHQVIDHAECYVKGQIHTNGLENFWSLFKRCIHGTHISVEPFHLFRYLDTETFRFNNRKMDDRARFLIALQGINGRRLTYKSLTGENAEGQISGPDADPENHPN